MHKKFEKLKMSEFDVRYVVANLEKFGIRVKVQNKSRL